MKLGFAGLGQMGGPIAHTLMKGGADVIVGSRSDRRFDESRDRGATATTDLAGLADADVLFLCLPGTEEVRSTLLGDGGLADRLRRGQTVVDLSTIGCGATVEIGRVLEAKGVAFLDAPISGMEARAVEGTLTVMCGGARVLRPREAAATPDRHQGPVHGSDRQRAAHQADEPTPVRHQRRGAR